jgi:hypothetical protein
LRCSNGVRRCASSSATRRLTVVTGILSLREAAEKLPVSTTASSVAIASKRSMIIPFRRKMIANLRIA